MGKEGWMDRRTGREVNGQKAGVDRWGDGWKNVLLGDGLAPIQKERWMDEWMNRQKDGQMNLRKE